MFAANIYLEGLDHEAGGDKIWLSQNWWRWRCSDVFWWWCMLVTMWSDHCMLQDEFCIRTHRCISTEINCEKTKFPYNLLHDPILSNINFDHFFWALVEEQRFEKKVLFSISLAVSAMSWCEAFYIILVEKKKKKWAKKQLNFFSF